MATNRTSPKKGKVVDIPTAPTIGTATAGAASATVAFTAATQGGPVATYTALSNPGSITGTGSSSPVTVSGLTEGTTYTFTVRGSNATGNGEYSAVSNSITALPGSVYESIQTITLSSNATSVTFSGIPSTYTNLQIRGVATMLSAQSLTCRLGSGSTDTGSNYNKHALWGNSAGVQSAGYSGSYFNIYGYTTGVDATAPAAFVMDIVDYKNTNKFKVAKSLAGQAKNAIYGEMSVTTGLWRSTSAVDTITIFTEGGDSMKPNSTFALYGIRG